MEPKFYIQYQEYSDAGDKKNAKQAITRFVNSFKGHSEKQVWTRHNLPEINQTSNGRIRHELYEQVIFPVLVDGFKSNQPWSLLWLARTIQNIYQAKTLWKQIDHHSDFDLLSRAFEQDEDSAETRDELLQCLIGNFRHHEHEWPSGILSGMDGADNEACETILSEIALAQRLDSAGTYGQYLNEFELKIKSYRKRL